MLFRLKNALHQGIKIKLCDKPDQGLVVSVSCRSHYSSRFMLVLVGKYTRFKEWRLFTLPA